MLLKRYLLFLTLALSSASYAQNPCYSLRYKEPVFTDTTMMKDLKYATADPYGLIDNQDLLMDIYMPEGDTLSKRPLILYMYGGGFLIGFKEQPPIPYYAQYFTSLGYVFAAFNYRLGFNTVTPGSPERAVYRAVQDLRAAERFLVQRASQFRLDTSKFILMGSSAGSIAGFHSTYMEYAEAAAFSTPIPVLDGEVLGGVDSSGNNDFDNRYIEPFAIINQWGALVDTGMIDPDEGVPVVSFHGDQDNAVQYVYGYPFSFPIFPALFGSRPIHEKQDQMGFNNKLYTLSGYGHEPELTDLSLRDTILFYSKEFLYPLLKPATSAISGPVAICATDNAVYSVIGTSGSRYCWQISGGGTMINNSGNSITVQWSDTGNVLISVMEQTINGTAGDLQTFTTHVSPKVSAGFSVQVDELQIALQNNAQNALNTLWTFGDNTSSTDIQPQKQYVSGGTYNIIQYVDNGVCSDTFSTVVTVDSCPKSSFVYSFNNLTGTFNAQNTNTVTYYWSFGDGTIANVGSPNVLHFYNQPGVYTVSLIVQNGLNCSDTTSITVSLTPSAISEITSTCKLVSDGNLLILNCDKQERIGTFRLYDISGRELVSQLCGNGFVFDGTHIPPGSYFAFVEGLQKPIRLKFVKNR